MKVKIKDQIYDSNEEPIMLILTDIEKEHIRDMPSECTKYASAPDSLGAEGLKAFMGITDSDE